MFIDDHFPVITLHRSSRTIFPDAEEIMRNELPLVPESDIKELADVCIELIDAGAQASIRSCAQSLKAVLIAYNR